MAQAVRVFSRKPQPAPEPIDDAALGFRQDELADVLEGESSRMWNAYIEPIIDLSTATVTGWKATVKKYVGQSCTTACVFEGDRETVIADATALADKLNALPKGGWA